jgi:hypothetical protein
MTKEITGYIPKLLFKFYLHLKGKFDGKPKITQEEIYCTEICSKLIASNESLLTYAPISNKRFIKNDDKHMFIVIDSRMINLINHVYSYSVYIENDQLYSKLIQTFDTELEKRRQKLEDEMRSNIQHSLKQILEKLN